MPAAPKNPATRQRRNKVTTAATLSAPRAEKVQLPTRYSSWICSSCYLRPGRHSEEFFDKEEIAPHDFEPAEAKWQPATLKWWETIWNSPMTSEWVDADVPGLTMIAVLVDDFWRTPSGQLLAEIRMQGREYGLSPLARRSLSWVIKRDEAESRKPPARPVPTRRQTRGMLGVLEGGKAQAS